MTMAKERNNTDCRQIILDAIKPNVVFTYSFVCEIMEHRHGERTIRRVLKLLVQDGTLRQWEDRTIFFYELSSSERVAF